MRPLKYRRLPKQNTLNMRFLGVPWCPNDSECQGVGCSRLAWSPSWSHFWEANGLCSTSQRLVLACPVTRNVTILCWSSRLTEKSTMVLVREGGNHSPRAVTWTISNISNLMHVFAYIPLLKRECSILTSNKDMFVERVETKNGLGISPQTCWYFNQVWCGRRRADISLDSRKESIQLMFGTSKFLIPS
jgi:hypothetical protein